MAEKRSQEAASRAREAQQHAATERLAQQLAEEEEMARRMTIERRGEAVRRRWAEMREKLEGGSERVREESERRGKSMRRQCEGLVGMALWRGRGPMP